MTGSIVRKFFDRKPLTRVVLGKPVIDEKGGMSINQVKEYVALIDTGATSSIITEEVAKELDLTPVGTASYMSVSHEKNECTTYDLFCGISVDERIKMEIKDGMPFPTTTAQLIPTRIIVGTSDAIKLQGIHMLLGMDIISMGQLSITKDSFILTIG